MHQFRGVIFLSCIEEIECRLGLFATIQRRQNSMLSVESRTVTDAHGEVFIVVHHFTEHSALEGESNGRGTS